MRMPIAKITTSGLIAIALAVASLWSCLIGERVLRRRALAERSMVIRQVERLQRLPRPEPVWLPLRTAPRRPAATAG